MSWHKYRLPVGVLVLVVAVGALVWAMKRPEGSPAKVAASGESTLPTIDADAVTALRITRPKEPEIELVKDTDGTWRLDEPLDARADQSAAQMAVDKLGHLTVQAVAATKAANHAVLGVDDAHAVQVEARAGDKTVAKLLIGDYKGGSTMVRVDGKDDVLAVRGSLKYAFDKPVKGWRDRTILDIDPSTVRAVRFESDKGDYHFVRGADGKWAPAPGQAPIDKLSPDKVERYVSALSRARASDFAAADADPKHVALDAPVATVTLDVVPKAPPPAKKTDTDGGVSAASAAPAPKPYAVVLRLGAAVDAGGAAGETGETGERYLAKAGDSVVYVVSSYLVEHMEPGAKSFVETPPPKGAPAGPAAQGMPAGGGSGQQISPEVMQQIREQLRRQGLNAH